MTESEAIKHLENHIRYLDYNWKPHPDYSVLESISMAINALKKQIPKKPLYKQGTRYKWIDSVREHGRYHNVEKYSNRDACPNCKKDVLKTQYCEYCGQKLDWSE